MSAHDYDTEFTLSTGKLLAIFFGMVVICGIFFSLGFAVGRNSSPAASAAVIDSAQVNPVSGNGTAKPTAAGKTAEPSAADTAGDMKVSQAPAGGAQPESAPASDGAKTVEPGAGYMVQVAAVSKQEDADALVNSLRKKQYPVFIFNNPTSKLFHVQVGPFANQKDAEAMKSKLSADGYNAILKK
ncbi:MAG: SPOR domain-containing protein [Acidobacteriales bacterium]|nr:SPOR domain-containing protein [Terriglobales bacterium]